MHLLELADTVDLGSGNVIKPGRYLLDDIVAAQLLIIAGRGLMTPAVNTRPLDITEGGRILFLRTGGYGDLTLLTPVLRELKRRLPLCHLAVCSMPNYAAVLAGLPYVDEIVPFPCPYAVADSYDAWVILENAVERNPRAKEIHMTDLFAELAGVDMTNADKLPEYRVKPSEAMWAAEQFPRVNGTRRISIQVGASGPARVYHRSAMGNIIFDLAVKGWQVMLLGSPGEVQVPEGKKIPHNVHILTNSGMSFRQSCAVVAGSDVFLGADSALLHVAGALSVPAVGLYAAFPWRLRTAYCPTTFAIEGKAPCAPCFFHSTPNGREHFPEHCPSKAHGVCEVLARIKPSQIIGKIEQIARTPWEHAAIVEFPAQR